MTVATFRFYEELNDFLAPERRKVEFSYACARAATVKNAIEAIGVTRGRRSRGPIFDGDATRERVEGTPS
jgi:hypothetical protein